MNKPIIKEVFADNGEHSHWELINSDNGEVIWTEDKFNQRIEYVPIKSIAQNSICFDDFRSEKLYMWQKIRYCSKLRLRLSECPYQDEERIRNILSLYLITMKGYFVMKKNLTIYDRKSIKETHQRLRHRSGAQEGFPD